MRTISAKVLLWTLLTFAASLVAFGGVTYLLATSAPGPAEFFSRTFRMIEDEAVRAYEEGGPGRLADYLKRLNGYYDARHFLTDPRGVDLATGEDRSAMVEAGSANSPHPTRLASGEVVVVHSLGDDRYRSLVILPGNFDPRGILPYFGGIVLAIGLLGYSLAVHLARPLKELRGVVDRFGGGDLAARSRSSRRDEIGELSRAFDAMADQIQSLRAAELRLLQDVSHELRSPLARLGFNLELARSGDDREVPLDRIEKDIHRLSTLVGEILQLTCAEGDPTSKDLQDVDLDELLGSLIDDCSSEATAKGCRLVLKGEGGVNLIGDRELLRRGFENVVRNAIRYAPEGTPIEVEVGVVEEMATITVRDHGTGVPEAALRSIFEPFYRVDGDRSRASGGVGLGLAIARRAIELHHGQMTARNASPGLCILIEFPVDVRVMA